MARISLIIPTHNRAAMLTRAVESAKRAGTDLEIIVVDDASNDETQSIFRDRKDIIYLRMEHNVGQAHARNEGISRSTGEYLVFLDDDDLRLPGSLDTQAEILDNDKNLGFVYGQVLIADPQSLPTGVIKPSDCPTGDIFWDLLRDNFIYIASVMVRKQHMEAIGRFSSDVLGTEDWDAWLRLAAICKVGAVQEPCRHLSKLLAPNWSNVGEPAKNVQSGGSNPRKRAAFASGLNQRLGDTPRTQVEL